MFGRGRGKTQQIGGVGLELLANIGPARLAFHLKRLSNIPLKLHTKEMGHEKLPGVLQGKSLPLGELALPLIVGLTI